MNIACYLRIVIDGTFRFDAALIFIRVGNTPKFLKHWLQIDSAHKCLNNITLELNWFRSNLVIFINFRRSPREFGARFFISLIHLWLFHDKWAKIRRTSKMCSSTKEIRGELRKSKNKLSESELYQLLTKIDVYEFMYLVTAHIGASVPKFFLILENASLAFKIGSVPPHFFEALPDQFK